MKLPTCPACGGDTYLLGALGNRVHVRCRACGLDSSFVQPQRRRRSPRRRALANPVSDNTIYWIIGGSIFVAGIAAWLYQIVKTRKGEEKKPQLPSNGGGGGGGSGGGAALPLPAPAASGGGAYAFAPSARFNPNYNPNLDPLTGQPRG